MIQVRDAVAEDAASIGDLLGELGYTAAAPEIPARLRAVGEAPGRYWSRWMQGASSAWPP
jgi:hypothetical protein